MRLRTETGSNPVILVAAIVATLVVLILFSIDTAQNEPETFVAMLVIGALTVVFDFVWKRLRDRQPTSTPNSPREVSS